MALRMSYRIYLVLICIVSQSEAINEKETTSSTPILNTKESTTHFITTLTPKSVMISLSIRKGPRRLVGGNTCGVENYPFMVSIRRLASLSHFCAGSLLRPNWVMTAAHCLSAHWNQPQLFTVIAGISETNPLGAQSIKVKEIFLHQHFDEDNYDNDIALISLEHDFVITNVVKPIDIPNQVIHENIATICPEGTAIGWGWHNESKSRHKENGSIPHVPIMQCVLDLPILTDIECQDARAGVHPRQNTFCTMVPSKQNLCQGDSGGPIFCNNIQFGIVSIGYTCYEPGDTPGYYTRIDRVLNFIKECLSGNAGYARYISLHERDAESASIVVKLNLLCLHVIVIFSSSTVFWYY